MAIEQYSICDLEALWLTVWNEMFRAHPDEFSVDDVDDLESTHEVGTVLQEFVRRVNANSPKLLKDL